LQGSQEILKTLERQHKITLRRVEQIERRVAAGASKEDLPVKQSLVDWFMDLLGIRPRDRRDGTRG
jgi:hypothetical protein